MDRNHLPPRPGCLPGRFFCPKSEKQVQNHDLFTFRLDKQDTVSYTIGMDNEMTNTNEQQKRVTRATIKAFLRRNNGRVFIKNDSDFDGSVDCVMPCSGKWRKAKPTERLPENTLGMHGAWFVGRSNDWFSRYSADGFTGYSISNCCGSFVIATADEVQG